MVNIEGQWMGQLAHVLLDCRDLCIATMDRLNEPSAERSRILDLRRRVERALSELREGIVPPSEAYREMSNLCKACVVWDGGGLSAEFVSLFLTNAKIFSAVAEVEEGSVPDGVVNESCGQRNRRKS